MYSIMLNYVGIDQFSFETFLYTPSVSF